MKSKTIQSHRSTTSPPQTQSSEVRPILTKTTSQAIEPPSQAVVPTDGQILPPENQTVEYWAHKISLAIGNSMAWLIQAGQELLQAKAALPHGKWMRLFEPDLLRISLRTAQVLMRIARHPYLSKSKNSSHLPQSLSTLYELSKLNADDIQYGVEDHIISPDMTASQARAFLLECREEAQPSPKPAPPHFDSPKHLARVKRYLLRQVQKWPLQYQVQLAEGLRTLAQQIATGTIQDEAESGEDRQLDLR